MVKVHIFYLLSPLHTVTHVKPKQARSSGRHARSLEEKLEIGAAGFPNYMSLVCFCSVTYGETHFLETGLLSKVCVNTQGACCVYVMGVNIAQVCHAILQKKIYKKLLIVVLK